MNATTWVVPCYNEEKRLDLTALDNFVEGHPEVRLLFVDDGSKDGTLTMLREAAAQRAGRFSVLPLSSNGGKGEAVRSGMLAALDDQSRACVGYFDADLSTPPAEIARLMEVMRRPGVDVVMGARVALLGSNIQRTAIRHYLGRVFASVASLILKVPVYDTQCGAKLFRRSDALREALREPLHSRWAFDVELLGRLLTGTREIPGVSLQAVVEVPLGSWCDVPGSKLRPAAMAGAIKDLGHIGLELAQRRRAAGRSEQS